MSNKIITKKGTYKFIRVDQDFLCKCGCGRRISGKYKFFSKKCYYNYLKQNNVRRTSPESITKGYKTRKELEHLIRGLKI